MTPPCTWCVTCRPACHSSHLMVLATSRDPLPDAVTGLAGSSVLRLGPMTQREVGQFLGAGVHPSWVRAVHERSGGNPLYVTELVRVLDPAELRAPAGVVAASGRSGAPDRSPVEPALTWMSPHARGRGGCGRAVRPGSPCRPWSGEGGHRGRCPDRCSRSGATAAVVTCGGSGGLVQPAPWCRTDRWHRRLAESWRRRGAAGRVSWPGIGSVRPSTSRAELRP